MEKEKQGFFKNAQGALGKFKDKVVEKVVEIGDKAVELKDEFVFNKNVEKIFNRESILYTIEKIDEKTKKPIKLNVYCMTNFKNFEIRYRYNDPIEQFDCLLDESRNQKLIVKLIKNDDYVEVNVPGEAKKGKVRVRVADFVPYEKQNTIVPQNISIQNNQSLNNYGNVENLNQISNVQITALLENLSKEVEKQKSNKLTKAFNEFNLTVQSGKKDQSIIDKFLSLIKGIPTLFSIAMKILELL